MFFQCVVSGLHLDEEVFEQPFNPNILVSCFEKELRLLFLLFSSLQCFTITLKPADSFSDEVTITS